MAVLSMSQTTQKRILKALLLALRPVSKALMQYGIGFKEFSDVAKTAFVQVATEEYGLRGRPTNISRVSVITGISRKEVGKVRSDDPEVRAQLIKGTPAGEVLHRWHTDSRYLTKDGEPSKLLFEGGKSSFGSLVKKVAGDIPPGAMKAELMRVQAIEELPSGELSIMKRHYVPARVDDRLLHGLDTAIKYLADTIAFNSDPNRNSLPRFERVVSSVKIDPEAFDQIEESTRARLEKFTEEYDDYLSRQESGGEITDASTDVGVGVYFFRVSKQ
jgi:hypothetical protein